MQSLKFPRELRLFWMCMALLCLACVATELYCSRVLHLGLPYSWPLTPRIENMVDFNVFRDKFRNFHHLNFFTDERQITYAYPAPVAILYKLAYLIHWHPFMTFRVIILLGPVVGAVLLSRFAMRLGYGRMASAGFFASTLLLSFPLLFEVKQGNMEIFVSVLIALGVYAFLRGRGYTAAACFGVAGSMKIFPLIYLGILISKRMYRQVAYGFLAAAVSTVVSLWLLVPNVGIAWRGTTAGMNSFQQVIVLQVVRREVGFDHSLFSIVKRVWEMATGQPPTHGVLSVYMALAAVLGTVLFFTRIIRLPVFNQIICLCIASILLPPVSYEYTLIHLYVPWALLAVLCLCDRKAGRRTDGMTVALLLFAALMAPLMEFIHAGVPFGGQIKAVLLAALWYVAMKYPFELAADEVGPKGLRVDVGWALSSR